MPATSPKYQEAEKGLPDELKPVFARLVREYEFLTKVQYGTGYVAYSVLAEIILAGWRPAADPHPNSRIERP